MNEFLNYSLFKGLFEHTSIGMVIVNQEGDIEKVNPFLCEMFGHSEEELIGQKIEVLLPKNMHEEHVEYRKKYVKNPTPRSMGSNLDITAIKKNGESFPVEVSLSFYYINNELKVVSLVNDITERLKNKERLKSQALELEQKVKERTKELTQVLMELNHSNESLESEIKRRIEIENQVRDALANEKDLNELKSRFVSMASHEFRTPLAGILTSVSLLARYNTPETQDKRDKHIKTIKKAVHYLTSVLNDFLSLDKFDQGKIGANPSKFPLIEYTQEVINQIEEMSEEKYDIQFHVDGHEFTVFQDQDMYRNTLINLISNAMKYSKPGSKVLIKLEVLEHFFNLIIKDEGIGIPKKDQKHLFNRFFRAKNVVSIQGTGLGLNIVKKYIEYMRGSIQFESQENIGTTFTISLPLEIKS